MKIALTGANGYLGKNIIKQLEEGGTEILKINRNLLYDNPELLAKTISGCHGIINLAGAPILKRWTKKTRATIYNSRVLTTRNLVAAINSLPRPQRPSFLISASATGIYRENMNHDESSSKFANNFAARVVDDWEDALVELNPEIRQVIFRTGIVLGKESQTIQKLLPLFKLGLGAKIGNGKQPFPFIHVHDLVKAYLEAVGEEKYSGIYNLVAPDQITNKDFTRILAKYLKRPALFTVPAIVIKLMFGKASVLLLENATIHPLKLVAQNFKYGYPTLNECLKKITS